ncbi:hypothetical protein HMPREF9436_01303 [Faecalibacterium cf. prausnitzii KLE1255]|uniref:Uncharacterized protein n=1 Tax=Faecalibacterium cf. prausnitzii KLE1255 TaxID=748224 RepID=E2ZI12_9FIRM|nr:hypothetical protein HMPREF9436_01303 [Faecalibacterium cf. prausnitzii KLE1255]
MMLSFQKRIFCQDRPIPALSFSPAVIFSPAAQVLNRVYHIF